MSSTQTTVSPQGFRTNLPNAQYNVMQNGEARRHEPNARTAAERRVEKAKGRCPGYAGYAAVPDIKTPVDDVPPTPASGSHDTLANAYLRAGQAREQKQAEIDSLKLLEMRLERRLIHYQINHVSGPFK